MKSFLAMGLLVLSFTSNAFACDVHEAQVMGRIDSVKKIQDVCFYKVSIDSISEHALCPLTKYEIEKSHVQYEAGYHDECLYRFKGEFSGILVKDRNGVITFD